MRFSRAVAAILVAASGACGGGSEPGPGRVASVDVSPQPAALAVGATQALTATLRDASANVLTGRTVAWSSSNVTVASVSSSGLVTAVSPGTATIIATSEGKTGTALITVLAPPASVTVSLNYGTVMAGQTVDAQAVVRDGSGNVLTTSAVTWSSSNPSIAAVTPDGFVTTLATDRKSTRLNSS